MGNTGFTMRARTRTVCISLVLVMVASACNANPADPSTAPTGPGATAPGTTAGSGGGQVEEAVIYIADGGTLWAAVPGAGREAIVEDLTNAFQTWALGGLVWVAESAGRLLGVDPRSGNVVVEAQIGEYVNEVAVDDSFVWVLAGLVGSDSRILKIDRSTGATVATVTAPEGSYFSDLDVGEGAVWAVGGNPENLGYISKIDAATATLVETFDAGLLARRLVPGFGAVWVVGDEYSSGMSGSGLVRLDPATGEELARIGVAEVRGLPDIAIGYGSVWVTDTLAAAVVRVDPTTNSVIAQISIGQGGQDLYELDMARGLVWAGNPFEGRIYAIDPTTNQIGSGVEGLFMVKDVAFAQ